MFRQVSQNSSGADLLAHYRATGAPEIFAQIMRAYGGMVYNVCVKITKDAADAEDASQAVFLTLAVQCKTGATISYLGPWLKKVAKRTSLDLVRSRKRRTRRETVTAENRPEHYTVAPSKRSADGEIHEIIRAELEELPPKYRMPLVLHYFGGMNHEQISREMRCTTAALGVRLHRARKMLGKRLAARNITLEGAALGAFVAAAVQYVVHDRLIHSTTQAVASLTLAPSPVATAVFPASLGHVPQLVQEVASSMARAKTRVATLALAASVTMLGGAAEAVRHLPDSMKPSIDILSPTRAIENLFRSTTPGPKGNAPKVDVPKLLAEGTGKSGSSATDGTAVHYGAPPLVLPGTPQPQPVLASKVPVIPPVVVVNTQSPLPLTLKPKGTVESSPPPRSPVADSHPEPVPPPPVVAEGPTNRNSTYDVPAGVSSGAGSHDQLEQPVPLAPVVAAAYAPDTQSITSYVPSPDQITGVSSNLSRLQKLRAYRSTLIDGSALPPGPECPLPLPSSNGIQPVPLTPSASINVAAGDGVYDWSDPGQGVQPGGVNSIRFTVDNAQAPGSLTVQTLPLNTLLAPERPTGHHFIGLWKLDTSFDYDELAMTVRYDSALADTFGLDEKILKLWVYDDDQWVRIVDSSFARDLENHTLSGAWKNVEFIGVSAPEPTSLLFFGALGTAALLHRRRRPV